jgi:hypothetical protein
MWETIAGLGVAIVGGFLHQIFVLGSLKASVDDIKNNHLQHIYASLATIQEVLMKKD